jgi:hyperosmotically inducible periplasmic protein
MVIPPMKSGKEEDMKVVKLLATILVLTFMVSHGIIGCTVYDAARDERSIGTFIDDKAIAGKIKYTLLRDDTVKGLDIAVYVYDRKVFLVGVVEKSAQKSEAVKIAKNTKWVDSVTTYLLNKSDSSIGKSVDDTAITTKIKARMINDMAMKATQVKVRTIFGHVVLLGVVGSRLDMDKAIKYAKGVENVREVKSFIMVK